MTATNWVVDTNTAILWAGKAIAGSNYLTTIPVAATNQFLVSVPTSATNWLADSNTMLLWAGKAIAGSNYLTTIPVAATNQFLVSVPTSATNWLADSNTMLLWAGNRIAGSNYLVTVPVAATNRASFYTTNVMTSASGGNHISVTTTTNANGIALAVSDISQTNVALNKLSLNDGSSLTSLSGANITGTLSVNTTGSAGKATNSPSGINLNLVLTNVVGFVQNTNIAIASTAVLNFSNAEQVITGNLTFTYATNCPPLGSAMYAGITVFGSGITVAWPQNWTPNQTPTATLTNALIAVKAYGTNIFLGYYQP